MAGGVASSQRQRSPGPAMACSLKGTGESDCWKRKLKEGALIPRRRIEDREG
jgi:hypothetical protein